MEFLDDADDKSDDLISPLWRLRDFDFTELTDLDFFGHLNNVISFLDGSLSFFRVIDADDKDFNELLILRDSIKFLSVTCEKKLLNWAMKNENLWDM